MFWKLISRARLWKVKRPLFPCTDYFKTYFNGGVDFLPESPAIGFLRELEFGLNIVAYCRPDTVGQQTHCCPESRGVVFVVDVLFCFLRPLPVELMECQLMMPWMLGGLSSIFSAALFPLLSHEAKLTPVSLHPGSITAGSVGRQSAGSAAASGPVTRSWASSSKSESVIPVTTPSKTKSKCPLEFALLCPAPLCLTGIWMWAAWGRISISTHVLISLECHKPFPFVCFEWHLFIRG